MGRYDEDSKRSPAISLTTMFVLLLLFSVFFNVLQNMAIGNIESKLDKIEPIIDHYCLSSNDLMEYCNEVLEGYNNQPEKTEEEDVVEDKIQINIGN